MASLAAYVSAVLTADLEWREAELAVMRKQLYLSAHGSLQEKVLMRASVAMVYAHYEGFCKLAVSQYIDSISKLKLRRSELNFKLASYSLDDFRSSLSSASGNAEFFSEFLLNFNAFLGETAVFKTKMDTSNLWPEQLVSWLNRLDLDAEDVVNVETLLESLVRNRNQIAHGQKLVVSSRKDLDTLSSAATTAMHKVAVEVVDALDKKSYKNAGALSTAINHAV